MHTCVPSGDVCCLAKFFSNASNERTAALSVKQTHSPDVPRKMSFANEVRQYRLKEMRRPNVHCSAHPAECFDQIRGNHQISQSQRWKKHFAERAHVNHAGTIVESLQRRDWHALIAVLAVVVVFNDPRT